MDCELPSEWFSKVAWEKCIPISASLELTYRCNVRCRHCYCCHEPLRRELTTKQWLELLQQLADSSTLYLLLTGGEPLLRPDWLRIARRARRLGFLLRIFTNGTLVTPEVADEIAGLYPHKVEISFLGATDATHDALTGVPGSRAAAARAVDLLKERGVAVVVKWVLMQPNFHERGELLAWATAEGFEWREDTIVTAKNDGSLEPTALRMDDAQVDQYARMKSPASRLGRPPVESGDISGEPVCGAARLTVTISPYGDVYPCTGMPLVSGNIIERRFGEVWKDSPQLRRIRGLTVGQTKCGDCELAARCIACPGVSLAEHGDERAAPREICRHVLAAARAAGAPSAEVQSLASS